MASVLAAVPAPVPAQAVRQLIASITATVVAITFLLIAQYLPCCDMSPDTINFFNIVYHLFMVSGTNVVKLRIMAHFLYNMHNNISNICQLT